MSVPIGQPCDDCGGQIQYSEPTPTTVALEACCPTSQVTVDMTMASVRAQSGPFRAEQL